MRARMSTLTVSAFTFALASLLCSCGSDGNPGATSATKNTSAADGDETSIETARDAGRILDARVPDASFTSGDAHASGIPIHSDASRPSDANRDAAVPPGAAPSSQPPSQTSAACAKGERASTGRFTLMVSGQQREYLLHVPSASDSAPLPLVLALHGYTMSAGEHEQITGFSDLADREGFAVVYPEGIGDTPGWNAGSCCAYEQPPRDDMAFMASLIERVGEQLCLDLTRVYSTGFSNGGMMTYRLACEMSKRIAAVASVSGSIVIPLESCRPSHPMPLMHTHGTDDPLVPYAGGSGPAWLTPVGETPPDFPAVRQEVEAFVSRNACSGSAQNTFQNGDASCETYSGCASGADVTICTITGGGHAWPGGGDMGSAGVILGTQSQSLPTTQKIWEFLKPHHLL